MNQSLKTILELLQNMQLAAPENEIVQKAIADADRQWGITEFKLDRTEKVKKTTAVLLEKTIEELEEKRKAVEAQNRELEIEAALESVRSRSLAMHTSDELQDVVHTVFEKLKELNVDLYTAIIFVFSKGSKDVVWWLANKANQQHSRITIPYDDNPYLNDVMDTRQSGRDFFSRQYSFEEKNQLFHHLFEHTDFRQVPEEQKKFLLESEFATMSVAITKNIGINITSYSRKSFSASDNEILKRFANVFDQSYTRFLDLQKAEAQAREAHIEAALERVRSRSLAMHKSDELSVIAKTMFEQLRSLGLELEDGLIIMLFREDSQDQLHWPVLEGLEMDTMFVVPYFDHPVLNEVYKARETGVKFIERHFDKTIKDDFLEKIFSITDYKAVPVEFREKNFAGSCYHYSFAMEKFTGILMHSYNRERYPAEYNDIIKRFARVFEQAYIRFLDLQKAEAQAREAEIELGLERVRARTMAMQRSEELKDAASVLFQQAQALGARSFACGFSIWGEEKKTQTYWMAQESMIQPPFTANSAEDVFHDFYLASERGESLYVKVQEGKELEAHYRYMATIPGFKEIMEKMEQKGLSVPTFQILHCAFFSKGFLLFITYEPIPEIWDVFKRFAKVFEQTYTRFLDLQKAEAQAREAQIEAALERVRSRTMAMHIATELPEATALVYKELSALGITNMSVAYALVEPSEKYASYYSLSPVNGKIPTFPFVFPHTETRVMRSILSSWKKHEASNVIQLNEEATLQHQTYIGHHIQHLIEKNNIDMPFSVKGFLEASPKRAVMHTFNFAQGYLFLIGDARLTTAQEEMVLRFTKVFEMAYRRFLDLKKAEAQAREAQIEAALEKVRSRSLAMHQSRELSELVALLFDELTKLKLVLYRCIIWIIDPHDFSARLWMANSEDKSVADSYYIKPIKHPYYQALIKAWKERIPKWEYVLEGDNKKTIDHILLADSELSHLPDAVKKGILSSAHTIISGSFSNFGFIEASGPTTHTTEQLEILLRFGKVFDQSYTRFLDLQKAEAQAKEAQIEAALERVRSRAMAMHNSQDLADTIGVFYKELHSFSLTPLRCGVGLLDNEAHVGELFTWNTTEKGDSLELVGRLKMDGHPVLNGVYEHWVTQKEYHPVLHGNEIKEYYQILRPQIAFPDYTRDEVQYGYFFFFKEGGVYAWTEKEMQEDELNIYRRFTTVLSLTYKRYKDLQQAEAQAREAQIETALERVRSRTLAMQKSDELAETATVLFKQLILLGIEPNRLYINILKDEKGEEAEFWITDEDGSKVSTAYTANLNDNQTFKKMFEGWKEQKKSLILDMHDEELEVFFKHLSSLHVPFKRDAQKRRLQYIAYFSKGFIGMASPDEQPAETMQLLERFAYVFNLTFTRFNDLKVAEAHALQAELDLAEIKAAKKKAEDTISELQLAQKQLIQSEKMASLGELTAGIAHEIQNPLNFVNNFSEVSNELIEELYAERSRHAGERDENLEKDILNDIAQNLEKISYHGKRADAIVKGMLQHSRVSTGQKELTDINALCDEYLRLAYHGLRAKNKSFNAKFDTDFDNNIGKIAVIPQDIGRVLLNLVNNAFYAVNQKQKDGGKAYEPTVVITTKNENGKVFIAVKDNGDGIPKNIVDKIFQPFFTTKPTGQGTGLGLSLAYDIIKAHGGEVEVLSKESEGSTFIVQLPLSKL